MAQNPGSPAATSEALANDPTTPPGATALPKIFDTIDDHIDYVIFHDALMKVRMKIEYGTLAQSFDIVDVSADHKAILLNLKGRITFADFYDRFPNEKETYAVANASTGIYFNKDLVEKSHLFYQENQFSSIEEALRHPDGLKYSAVIQETFEHELAHLKIRKDYLAHHGKRRTPDGAPLHRESGFAVQQKIGVDHSTTTRAVGTAPAVNLDTLGREEDTVRILEVPREIQLRGYTAPIELVWGTFSVRRQELVSVATGSSGITREQLMEHMKYGGVVDPTTSYRDLLLAARPTTAPTASRKRGHDGEESDGGGGKRHADSRRRSPAARLFQAKLNADPATKGTLKASVAKVAANEAPVKTGASKGASVETGAAKVEDTSFGDDPEKLFRDLYYSILNEQKHDVFETMDNATLNVTFEDSKGAPRGYFLPSEPVYVSLTFSNSTENDVYVLLSSKNFARGGIYVEIDGCDDMIRDCMANRIPLVAAKLGPSESHTFIHRQLCDGPKPESREELLERSWNPGMIPYWTPTEGTHMVKFAGWENRFPLVIRKGD